MMINQKKNFVSKLIGDEKKCQRDKFRQVQPLPHLQLPYFYLLPKVHKEPWQTRPVVSHVFSVLEPMSQWIDVQLQQVLYLCPAYIQDTWQLLHDLNLFQYIPTNYKLFT